MSSWTCDVVHIRCMQFANVSVYLSVRTPCCVLVNCLLNAFVYVLIVVVLLCNVV